MSNNNNEAPTPYNCMTGSLDEPSIERAPTSPPPYPPATTRTPTPPSAPTLPSAVPNQGAVRSVVGPNAAANSPAYEERSPDIPIVRSPEALLTIEQLRQENAFLRELEDKLDIVLSNSAYSEQALAKYFEATRPRE